MIARIVACVLFLAVLSSCSGHSGAPVSRPPAAGDADTPSTAEPEPNAVPAVAEGPVYATPFRASADLNYIPKTPVPQATLARGTRVTILCKTPEPGKTLQEAESVLAVFYKISYPGGTGYADQADIAISDDVPLYVTSKIPQC